MSSSFGGSGGGSGSTIRYAIVIDDSQVNAKLANFQSTLGRVGTAAQQSVSGIQGLNSTFDSMDSSIVSASRDLDAINNNFRNMDSSIQSTTREMGALTNNFKGVEGGLTRNNILLEQGGAATKSLGTKMKGVGSFVKDHALAIGAVSSSVISLISNYTSLQKAQNSLEKAQNVEIGMRNKITTLTQKHAEAVKEHGANSQEAIKIERDLELVQRKHATQIEKLTIQQDQFNQQTAQTATDALSQVVLLGGGVADMATSFTSNAGRIKSALGGIKSAALLAAPAIAGIGTALGVAVAGIAASALISKWLKETNQGFQDLSDQGGKALDDLINKIPGLGGAWMSAEKDFSKFLLDTFPMLFTEQDKAFIKNRQLIKSNEDVGKSTVDVAAKQKIYDDALALYNDKLETRQVGDEKVAKAALDKAKADLEAAKATKTGEKALIDYDNAAGPLGMITLPTLSREASTAASAISSVTDATKKTVPEQITHRNIMRENREAYDEFWNSGINVGKVLVDNEGKVSKFNPVLGKFIEQVIKLSPALQNAIQNTETMGDSMIVTATAGAHVQSMIQNDIIALEGLDQGFADAAVAGSEFNKVLATLKEGTALKSIFKIEGKPDKVLNDLIKNLPNSFEKEIKLALKIDQKSDDLKESISNFLGFALQNLEINDQDADSLAKSIITEIDDKFKGKTMPQEWKNLKESIKASIADPNTVDTLWSLLKQIENKGPLKIPTVLDFAKSGVGGGKWSAEVEGGGIGDSLAIPIDSVTVTPKTIKIADLPGGGGGWGISPLTKSGEMLKMSADIEVIPKSMQLTSVEGEFASTFFGLTGNKALQMELDNSKAIKALDVVAKRIDSLTSLEPSISLLNKIAIKSIDTIAKRIDSLEKLKPQINLQNNKAIKAVDAVVKRIMSIEKLDPKVNVYVGLTGPGASRIAKGGTITRYGEGGIISAATGYTTRGPMLALIGDNPGGRETIAAIPHNDPWPTMALLQKQFGKNTSGEGSNIVINNITKIDGNEIFNDREFRKRVKLELGHNRDKFM